MPRLLVILMASIAASASPASDRPEFAMVRLGSDRFRTTLPTYSVAVSDDGTRVAVGTSNGPTSPKIVIFNGRDGTKLHEFAGFGHVVADVSFSPNGRYVATANGDASLAVFDLRDKKLKWRVPDCGRDVAKILPDGKTVVAEKGAAVVFFDLETGKAVGQLQSANRRVHGIAWTQRGDRIAAASEDGHVYVWETASRKLLQSLQVPLQYALGVAFSPDGSKLVHAGFNGDYALWDLETGKAIWKFEPAEDEAGGPVAFSADGSEVFGLRTTGRVFDTATGRVKRSAKNFSDDFHGAFSADRKVFYRLGRTHRVERLDLARLAAIDEFAGHSRPLTAVAFVDGGKALVTAAGWEPLAKWEVASGRGLARWPTFASALAAHPNGRRLAVWQNLQPAAILDALDGTSVKTGLFADGLRSHGAQLRWLRGPRPQLLFEAGQTVQSIEAHADKPIVLYQYAVNELHNSYPRTFATTNSGTTLVVHTFLGSPRIDFIDIATRKMVRTLQYEGTSENRNRDGFATPITNLQAPPVPRFFRPGDRTFVGESAIGIVEVDAATGKVLRTVLPRERYAPLDRLGYQLRAGGFPGHPAPMASSPDGRCVAVAGADRVYLIDIAAAEIRREFVAGGRATDVAFTSDGGSLATAHEDTTALVWDVYGARKGAVASEPTLSVQRLEGLTARQFHDAIAAWNGKPEALVALGKQVEAVAIPDAAGARAKLDELDSDRFAVREAAQRYLQSLGPESMGVIDEFLARKSLSAEARQRAERAKEALQAKAVAPAGRGILRTMELLERLGSKPAVDHLERLARGAPGAAITEEARAALERIRGR